MAQGSVKVRGLRELQRDFKRMSKDLDRRLTDTLKDAGQPAADEAEALAIGRIRNMPRSPQWAEMRVGVLRRGVVYIAPRQRGGRRKGGGRANLSTLLLDRAMDPAVARKADEVITAIGDMVDSIADRNGF